MSTTLSQIRFIVEQNIQDGLDNETVINRCNIAQSEFMLRVKIPASTTLVVDTSTITYTTLPATILEFRRFRFQSDIDNGYNRSVSLIFSYYNGKFEVPAPFSKADTLLIDYYSHLTTFTDIADTIDLPDRFSSLYTSYLESVYFNLPKTRADIGEQVAQARYEQAYGYYQMIKKQVMDYYIVAIGVEKPGESGW
jgi:hypothetical protein